jgi:predicted NACHT family NTPase
VAGLIGICCKTVSRDKSDEWSQKFLNLLFLEENKQIRELSITPILLSLTCAVFYQTGRFYSKRSKLYEEGLEILLDKWDKSREIERDEIYHDLPLDRKLELLSYLAVKKFEQTRYVLFEQDELEKNIAEFLGIELRDSRAVLKAIQSQHGILIERAQKIWSFSHLTFQEYFAAKWFINHSDYSNLIIHIINKNWQEIFLLVLDQIKIADDLLLLMKDKTDYLVCTQTKLQDLLTWATEKSLISPENKIKNKARLFYISLYIDFFIDIDINNISDFELENLEDKSSSYIYLAHELNLRHDSTINCILNDAFTLLKVFNETIDFDLHPDEVDNIALCIEQDFDSILEFKVPFNLKRKLQKLKKQLPSHDGIWESNYQEWWKLQGELWMIELRKIMLKNFNMGHDWQFSKEETELLKQYYDANELIIQCLTSCGIVSGAVHQEIENTLFLPIAEIEKYNREKLD